MRIKQKPEDFSVKESYRFDEVDSGRHRVYLMDKQKLSTFDAVTRLRDAFGLKPGAISYCGLKDKQGRTEQIIAVDGADVDMQDPDLRLKYLGRTDKPLSAANITSNRFSVTVRALQHASLGPLNVAAAEVNRLGVINYFDSQRFGSLKHGQGFIAKDLIRGDFEAALHNYMAKPSELDRTEDAKIKAFWKENWGRWDARVPYEGTRKYHRVLKSLRDQPGDYLRAFMQIDADYRAMLLFTYQSFLWNEGVRRYLQLMLPREHLFPMRYQAGTLLFHRDASPEVLRTLRDATFPLLAPNSTFSDPKVEEAVRWVLGREKLRLEDLSIPGAERRLYFKHEERPLLSFPHKLVVGRTMPDELNRDAIKVNVAFTLPPGAYATLVIKRLFHFEYAEDSAETIRASQRPKLAEAEAEAAAQLPSSRRGPPRRDGSGARQAGDSRRGAGDREPRGTGAPGRRRAGPREVELLEPVSGRARTLAAKAPEARPAEPTPPLGFRERQRQRKDARSVARAETEARRTAKARPSAKAKPPKSRKK
ncbi:tRNA pseudouridine(13) synthase TruD [Corallococcus macrosporus]|uniref:tRNA pseudouridine synthase D TruD n=1 Tax=Myxococcus fulvus (strain ATCC BAA-855 / HW-1) TaxID=483219 RepID=F8CGB3_MYXFH|nr:tRNA pseudouridine(13) synthase TruD [Corallococcus macrosporus]AEI67465.1 tRNA pseudouridine synthase D TruD [Corallococcus macrosporus]